MSLKLNRLYNAWVVGQSVGHLAALVAIAAAIACGCSSGSPSIENQKPVHPVKGRVTVKGQPATGAFVLLVPVNEQPDPKDPRPRAEVQADGSFVIWTYAPDDGAPLGEYVVAITWEDRDLGDKLGGRFADSRTSRLRANVKEGANELPPFEF